MPTLARERSGGQRTVDKARPQIGKLIIIRQRAIRALNGLGLFHRVRPTAV
jgi:hypothetical protein